LLAVRQAVGAVGIVAVRHAVGIVNCKGIKIYYCSSLPDVHVIIRIIRIIISLPALLYPWPLGLLYLFPP
jgi:hypothetical protein